jgi:hypothetical protein
MKAVFVRSIAIATALALCVAGCQTRPRTGNRKSGPAPQAQRPDAPDARLAAQGGDVDTAPRVHEPPESRQPRVPQAPSFVTDERGVTYGARIDESVVEATLHVATGSASLAPRDGSADRPFVSLAAAMRAALANLEAGIATRVLVHAGTYRESFGTLDFSRGAAAATLLVIEGADCDEVKETYDLAGWLAHGKGQEDGARFLDPKFVDPARGDFSLQPDSPMADREAPLPLMKIERERIDEIKAFFSWASSNTHVEPAQTLPQFLEFIRGLC